MICDRYRGIKMNLFEVSPLKPPTHTILLIGSGRLAKHLQFWNSIQSSKQPSITVKLITWNRSEDPQLMDRYVAEADLIWLAISDDAIVPFFEKHFLHRKKPVVHFSGALSDDRLWCAHPLMTFPKELFEPAIYHSIFFALTGISNLIKALPGFNNPFFNVAAQDKPLYHALCVVAGNFPQILWNEVDAKRQDLKIPEEAFFLYLQQTLNNFIKLKTQSLTGPLIRQDRVTIAQNMQALTDTKLQSIYQAFVKEFLL